MTIYDRIKSLRIKKGMSQDELAKKVGYESRSAISKVENGSRDISQSMIEKYASALDVTPTFLLYGDESQNGEQQYTVSDTEQEEYLKLVNIIPLPKMRKVPLVGAIACGEPILAAENIEGEIDMPDNIRADFALRCKGDSMINARIFDGDIVYIRKQESVENGEIAAVLIGDEATLKRVRLYDDHISLEPDNPMYKPLVYWADEMNSVKIIGRAVAFTSIVR